MISVSFWDEWNAASALGTKGIQWLTERFKMVVEESCKCNVVIIEKVCRYTSACRLQKNCSILSHPAWLKLVYNSFSASSTARLAKEMIWTVVTGSPVGKLVC